MRFALSEEQVAFGQALDRLLLGADVPSVARAWARGDHDPGLDLWCRLAELGLAALVTPEEAGGIDGTPLDVAVGFEVLGRHALPGPWIESAVLVPALLAATDDPDGLLPQLAEGKVRATIAAPPMTPYALDAAVATHVLVLNGATLFRAEVGEPLASVDATRRLNRVAPGEAIAEVTAEVAGRALDLATLACSAQLLGAGERLLADTVAYALQRKQFGRAIGEYQALKHALADVRVGLDFARPLVHGAALALAADDEAARAVSAAKVATADAAYRAARTGLQVHGAIGYTAEFDLSLWLTKVRALAGAWGTPDLHRGRVLASLTTSGR